MSKLTAHPGLFREDTWTQGAPCQKREQSLRGAPCFLSWMGGSDTHLLEWGVCTDAACWPCPCHGLRVLLRCAVIPRHQSVSNTASTPTCETSCFQKCLHVLCKVPRKPVIFQV